MQLHCNANCRVLLSYKQGDHPKQHNRSTNCATYPDNSSSRGQGGFSGIGRPSSHRAAVRRPVELSYSREHQSKPRPDPARPLDVGISVCAK